MATHAAVGYSRSRNSFEAAMAAARQAVDELGGRPDLFMVFTTARHDQAAVLQGAREVAGDCQLVGCSGEGVIARNVSMETDYALAIMAIRSDRLTFETFLLPNFTDDPAGRGRELADRVAHAADDAVGLFVFPDGLNGNCTDFLTALQDRLPFPLMVGGGTAADAMTFDRTYQFAGEEVVSNGVSAVLIRGPGTLRYAVSHGCSPIGLQRTVTRSDGNWVHEIDGKPAWSVFKEYLDGDPQDLNAEGIVHLCIGRPLEQNEAVAYHPYVIRTPLQLEKKTGSLFFPSGDLREGQPVQLTRRDPAQIKESARSCAQQILKDAPPGNPCMVFQFDCAGRGQILFGSGASAQIVDPLQEALGPSTPWIGFHTYGEIAPIQGHFYYHNYTVVLCALYD